MTSKQVAKQERTEAPEAMRWNPWEDFFTWGSRPWGGRLAQLMDEPWRMSMDRLLPPGAELDETDEAYELELDLPGVTKKDINIEVTGRRLAVHGTRTEKQRTGVLRQTTRSTGSFAYEVTLPTPVDEKAITASLNGGVLSMRIPKASDAKTTRIEIK